LSVAERMIVQYREEKVRSKKIKISEAVLQLTTTTMSIKAYMRALYVSYNHHHYSSSFHFISFHALQNPTSLHPLVLKSLFNSRVFMSACRSIIIHSLPLYHYLSLSLIHKLSIIHHSIIHSLLYYLTIIVIDQSVLNPQLINLLSVI